MGRPCSRASRRRSSTSTPRRGSSPSRSSCTIRRARLGDEGRVHHDLHQGNGAQRRRADRLHELPDIPGPLPLHDERGRVPRGPLPRDAWMLRGRLGAGRFVAALHGVLLPVRHLAPGSRWTSARTGRRGLRARDVGAGRQHSPRQRAVPSGHQHLQAPVGLVDPAHERGFVGPRHASVLVGAGGEDRLRHGPGRER